VSFEIEQTKSKKILNFKEEKYYEYRKHKEYGRIVEW
jgi:hypothetical protein